MTPTPADVDERGCDAAVIERSWAEPESFALLFDRHAARVHRYVARRLGQDLADDVVGETFLIAFRRRVEYDTTRSEALPWLYGIASRLVSKHRSAEVRFYRLLARTGVDPVLESHEVRADAKVTAQAAHRALATALARLEPRDRDVLLLIAWADLSYEAVAQTLDIPVGTVRSRLNRARRLMRAALGTDPTDILEKDTP